MREGWREGEGWCEGVGWCWGVGWCEGEACEGVVVKYMCLHLPTGRRGISLPKPAADTDEAEEKGQCSSPSV